MFSHFVTFLDLDVKLIGSLLLYFSPNGTILTPPHSLTKDQQTMKYSPNLQREYLFKKRKRKICNTNHILLTKPTVCSFTKKFATPW